MPKESELIERRIQEALQCRQEYPNRLIASLAKEYHVPYHRLRARLFGTPSKIGRQLSDITNKGLPNGVLSKHLRSTWKEAKFEGSAWIEELCCNTAPQYYQTWE